MPTETSLDQRRGLAPYLRRLAVDSPGSAGARARARRWDTIQALFPDIEAMSVVDLGGTVDSWRRAPVRPACVTVVNLLEPGESADPRLISVLGDACAARAVLASAGNVGPFDLVFSNSLIEHVGGHAKRVDLAHEIRALAPLHWVQTPYRYFPIEPHWLFPMMQFLPVSARIPVANRWPLAHSRPATRDQAAQEVMWTELVGLSELKSLFPGSAMVHERLAGLTKSVIAVRSN